MENPFLKMAIKSAMAMLGDFNIEADRETRKIKITQNIKVTEMSYDDFIEEIIGLFGQGKLFQREAWISARLK